MTSVDDAILDAVDKGVKVINMSFGSLGYYYPDIDDAIETAYDNGVVLVASSGNNNYFVYYPASHPYVIAVGATDQNNERCSFSNYGDNLELVAPGQGILSTVLQNNYNYDSGTSFAAPQVSGVVALMLSVNPTLTPDQIRSTLRNTCYKIPSYSYTSGWNNQVGYGLLNAFNAISAILPSMIGSSVLCDNNVYS